MNNLKNIYVHEDNETYYDIDGVLFMKETATLLYYPKGKTDTDYTIPDGTKIISSYAFYSNHSLTSISFAESVERIEKYVIYKCDSISSISIHSNQTIISNLSFVYEHEDEKVFSETFKSVTFNFGEGSASFDMLMYKVGDIYSYVTSIFPKEGIRYEFPDGYLLDPYTGMWTPYSLFYDDSRIESLRNGNTITFGERVICGEFEIFEYQQEIYVWDYIGTESHVIIPETINGKPVTGINELTFICENSPDMKELTIPMYIRNIEYPYLSPWNTGFPSTLENIYVDKDNPYLYTIDGALFSYSESELLWCPDKYEVYEVPDRTKSITYQALVNNSKLKELIVPSSVETIGEFILEYCKEVTTIRLPDKYIDIDQSAFCYTLHGELMSIVVYNESIKDIYIDTELSVYENEVDHFYKYFYNRFRIENVTVHFKDYKFVYADDIISKYSIDDNELIEKYDCTPIMILNTAESAKSMYYGNSRGRVVNLTSDDTESTVENDMDYSRARVLKLVDLTLDGIPELVRIYGRGTGQSYDIYDISDYYWYSFLMDEEKAFVEFHHYVNTLTNELVCTVTETDFTSIDNGRSEQTLQIVTNPYIGKMIVSATIYYESSVEYKINRNLIEIDISECDTVTQEEYNQFMEDYYLSFEEVTYPYVSKVIEQYYWDDAANETVELTSEEVSKAIDEAYNEYIALYEEFVK